VRPPYVLSETDLTKCGIVSEGLLAEFSYKLLDIYVIDRDLEIYTLPDYSNALPS